MADLADVLVGGVGHVALDLLAHECEGHSDGRDVRGVLGYAMADAHLLAEGGGHDGGRSAAADEVDEVGVEVIVAHEAAHDLGDLVHGDVHGLLTEGLHGAADLVRLDECDSQAQLGAALRGAQDDHVVDGVCHRISPRW